MGKQLTARDKKRMLTEAHRYLEAVFVVDHVSFNALIKGPHFSEKVRQALKHASGCEKHKEDMDRLRAWLHEETTGLDTEAKIWRLKELIAEYAQTGVIPPISLQEPPLF